MAFITFTILGSQTNVDLDTHELRIESASANQTIYTQYKRLLSTSVGAFQGTHAYNFKATSLKTSAIPSPPGGRPKHFVTMLYATIMAVMSRTGGMTTTCQSASAHYQAMPMRTRDRSFFLSHGGRRL